jgi:hypothetical protein
MAGATGGSPQALEQRIAALSIALGPTGLRRPEIGIKVLRAIGRDAFSNHQLRKVALNSPLFYGAKNAADGTPEQSFDDPRSKTPEADAQPESSEADNDDENGEAGLQPDTGNLTFTAAGFLAALADWALEFGNDKESEFNRQLPLHALMTVFERMPLLTRPDSTRLSLQDLVDTVAPRDPDLVGRILRGFVAAGAARKLTNTDYVAPRQLQNVFRLFAAERASEKKIRATQGQEATRLPYPVPDPYLSFAGWVRRALVEANAIQMDWVISGSERFLSQADKDAIINGGLVALPPGERQ